MANTEKGRLLTEHACGPRPSRERCCQLAYRNAQFVEAPFRDRRSRLFAGRQGNRVAFAMLLFTRVVAALGKDEFEQISIETGWPAAYSGRSLSIWEVVGDLARRLRFKRGLPGMVAPCQRAHAFCQGSANRKWPRPGESQRQREEARKAVEMDKAVARYPAGELDGVDPSSTALIAGGLDHL